MALYASGLDVSGVTYDAFPGDAALYDALTTLNAPPAVAGDRRLVLGVGPFELAAGETWTVDFAFVGGHSEAEIINKAEIAQFGFGCLPPCPATEPGAEDVSAFLHAPSPNPASGTTVLSFTLARPQAVRLSIHDALGREVALLLGGVRAADHHAVRWNAAGLPAGVYLVRLVAGDATAMRTVTLLR